MAVRVRRVPAFHAPAGWTASAGLSFKTSRPSVVKENASLIRVPGIAHILLENISPPPTDALPVACAELRARFDLDAEDAVGCLWLDTRSDPPILYPVVWVRATQSLCTESACGLRHPGLRSGSAGAVRRQPLCHPSAGRRRSDRKLRTRDRHAPANREDQVGLGRRPGTLCGRRKAFSGLSAGMSLSFLSMRERAFSLMEEAVSILLLCLFQGLRMP